MTDLTTLDRFKKFREKTKDNEDVQEVLNYIWLLEKQLMVLSKQIEMIEALEGDDKK